MNAAYKAGYQDGINERPNRTNSVTCHDVADYNRGFAEGQADANEINQQFATAAA